MIHRIRATWGFWSRAYQLWDLGLGPRTCRALRFLFTGYTGQFRPGPRAFAQIEAAGDGKGEE
jgi:hypothetical protein